MKSKRKGVLWWILFDLTLLHGFSEIGHLAARASR
jgi:hypothetical protein